MLGLVLAGGGARGAYEAGVLRFVVERFSPHFDVISGTSVGAINGAWIGSGGDVASLWSFWAKLRFEDVARFSPRDLLQSPARWLRRTTEFGEGVGLLDPSPLYALLKARVDWAGLHHRIDTGQLRAMMVTLTDVGSGRAHIFTDGNVKLRRAATSRAIPARVGPEHCLASAAIPFVFPAIPIDGRSYVDGALRQNTPLAPAIEAGVDHVLVIGVKRLRSEEATLIVQPTPGFLAGKALNALMLDPIEESIRRIEALNNLLTWAEGEHPGFIDRCRAGHKPYHVVHHAFLRPSEDLGRIAAETFRKGSHTLPWAVRTLLGAVAADEHVQEADLLSYLFFDRVFCEPLLELGYQDAKAAETDIARVLSAQASGA